MKRRLLVLSNAMDDHLRIERRITTDSPAASRKVFMLCQALKQAGVIPLVVSQGRGKAGGSRDFFPYRLKRHNGIPVYYAPFSRIRGLSELISMLAPLGILIHSRQRIHSTAVLFYNRNPAFLPALFLSTLLGYRNLLDLEDGEIAANGKENRGLFPRLVRFCFDRLCTGGALLACSALESKTRVRPVMCYYGTTEKDTPPSQRWHKHSVTVLMSGTLAPETGANLLADLIRQLRSAPPEWATQLHFAISGKGPSLPLFEALSREPGHPTLHVHGRLTDQAYQGILHQSELGLSLKPVKGAFADTTFPSKVVEFSSAGLLVLATDISDVRAVLEDGALYLTEGSLQELRDHLEWVMTHRTEAMICAERGRHHVGNHCAPAKAGRRVADFIFRQSP